jgi:hypothetical protein
LSLDLYGTGTLLRCPGGQVETVAAQKAAGMQWAALNIGSDPCVNRDPNVWDHQRDLYAASGIPIGPWMHCRSMADVEFLIGVGESWSDAAFIGCNVEDVVDDSLSLQEVGGYLLDYWVNPYGKPVHMPTLPWVQNGQGWQYVAFAYLALELFPLEQPAYCTPEAIERCIEHAFAEGAKRVTLLYSTTSPRSEYPAAVAHCLYTADNVTDWSAWKDTVPQVPPQPKEEKPVPLTPTQKKKVRQAISVYCLRAEEFRMNRGYSQRRPVIGYGLNASDDQLDDCSGFVSKVLYKAGQIVKVHIEDVLGFNYSGYGNTESMQTFLTHAAPAGKYLIGDIALWGRNDWDTTHTAICRKAGNKTTAIFTSHGHQSWRFADDAPEPITLPNFPEHLIGVFRHPALR